MTAPTVIARWIEFIDNHQDRDVRPLLAEDAVFFSPAVFTPQRGRDLTAAYLTAAGRLLGGPDFRYVGQWYAERSAILEFEATVDGLYVNGVDMITWNDDGLITEFKVMLRPFKALQAVMPRMAELLGGS
jgi:hypothetical protein